MLVTSYKDDSGAPLYTNKDLRDMILNFMYAYQRFRSCFSFSSASPLLSLLLCFSFLLIFYSTRFFFSFSFPFPSLPLLFSPFVSLLILSSPF